MTADTAARTPRLRTVDRLVLAYIALTSVVALVRLDDYPGLGWLLLAHALIALLVGLVTLPGLGSLGRALREIYPLVVLFGLYGALDVLNGGGRAPVHDAAVQRWEAALFGMQPSRDWWMRAPSPFWSALLHSAYLAYYAILVFPAIYLAAHRRLDALRHFLLVVMVTFFFCYLWFIFFPVAGPYYTFPHPTGEFVANLPARLVYDALAAGSSYGAAFPSSHVAATAAALMASWRGSRRLGWMLVVPTLLLTVSVVYCQMHYAVDAIAGVVTGVAIAAMLRPAARPTDSFPARTL